LINAPSLSGAAWLGGRLQRRSAIDFSARFEGGSRTATSDTGLLPALSTPDRNPEANFAINKSDTRFVEMEGCAYGIQQDANILTDSPDSIVYASAQLHRMAGRRGVAILRDGANGRSSIALASATPGAWPRQRRHLLVTKRQP
jgi:hypothetical protein